VITVVAGTILVVMGVMLWTNDLTRLTRWANDTDLNLIQELKKRNLRARPALCAKTTWIGAICGPGPHGRYISCGAETPRSSRLFATVRCVTRQSVSLNSSEPAPSTLQSR